MHPVWSFEIVAAVPGLEAVAPLVRAHHERWDGAGYPDGLAGRRIPLPSRIVAACDAIGALTTRPALPPQHVDRVRRGGDLQVLGQPVRPRGRVGAPVGDRPAALARAGARPLAAGIRQLRSPGRWRPEPEQQARRRSVPTTSSTSTRCSATRSATSATPCARSSRDEVVPERRRLVRGGDDPARAGAGARQARRARHAPRGLRLRRRERDRLRARLPGARGRRQRRAQPRLGAGLAGDVRDPPLGLARSRSRSGCRGWPPARRSAASA